MTTPHATSHTTLTAPYDEKIDTLYSQLHETDAARRSAMDAVNKKYATYLNAIEDEIIDAKHARDTHIAKLAQTDDNWLDDLELFVAVQQEAIYNYAVIDNAALSIFEQLPLFSAFTPDCGMDTHAVVDKNGTPHHYFVPALWITKQTPNMRIDELGPVMDKYFNALHRAYDPMVNTFNIFKMAAIFGRANGPHGVWTVTKDHQHGSIKLVRITQSHGINASIKFDNAAAMLHHIKQHMS